MKNKFNLLVQLNKKAVSGEISYEEEVKFWETCLEVLEADKNEKNISEAQWSELTFLSLVDLEICDSNLEEISDEAAYIRANDILEAWEESDDFYFQTICKCKFTLEFLKI